MKVNCNAWKVNSENENAPNFSAYFKDGENRVNICAIWLKADEKGQKYLSLSIDTDGLKQYQEKRNKQQTKEISTDDFPF